MWPWEGYFNYIGTYVPRSIDIDVEERLTMYRGMGQENKNKNGGNDDKAN